mgnify:CR=1 FL=1
MRDIGAIWSEVRQEYDEQNYDLNDEKKNVFDKVYDQYDLMNDFMSLGIHRIWKKSLILIFWKWWPSDPLPPLSRKFPDYTGVLVAGATL